MNWNGIFEKNTVSLVFTWKFREKSNFAEKIFHERGKQLKKCFCNDYKSNFKLTSVQHSNEERTHRVLQNYVRNKTVRKIRNMEEFTLQ